MTDEEDEKETKAAIMALVLYLLFIVLLMIGSEAYWDYGRIPEVEAKCADHEQRGWPDLDKHNQCRKYLPIIKIIKKYIK